jgi:hypothetical protein
VDGYSSPGVDLSPEPMRLAEMPFEPVIIHVASGIE